MNGECRQGIIIPKDEEPVSAILLPNGQAICACCGTIFDEGRFEIVTEFKNWIDLVAEIGGDEFQNIYLGWSRGHER